MLGSAVLGWLRHPRAHVALVATGLTAVLGTGVTTVALEHNPRVVRAAAAETRLPDAAPSPSHVARPTPAPVAAAPVPQVAALGVVLAPDVVIRSAVPLPAETISALQTMDGVTGVAVLDSASIDVAGQPAGLVGVDPSQFRAFTPRESAASDALWQSVAGGDVAASYGLAQHRSLQLGAPLPMETAPRLGAIAAFGLPYVDLVTTRAQARELGAVRDSVVLLTAPEVKTKALEASVREIVGDAELQLLRAPDVSPIRHKGKPSSWRELYIDSARYCPGLSWTILAAIGQVESAHGKHLGPSSAGALGPMQFLPSTWEHYGIDGDGDGKADIMNPFDAVPSAASYLCRHGATRGPEGLYDAIFAYNHADWYVQKVLALAAQYT